jgi:DNA-binding NtrC family response regulator
MILTLFCLTSPCPAEGGLDTLKQIEEEMPDLPVLILSMYPKDQYAVRALKMGAAGYLTKVSAPDELIKAIKKIFEGRKSRFFNLQPWRKPKGFLSQRTQMFSGPWELFEILCFVLTIILLRLGALARDIFSVLFRIDSQR